jgi:hypothetical protein
MTRCQRCNRAFANASDMADTARYGCRGSGAAAFATSGVTDRYGLNRYRRFAPGITGLSRHFVPARTGCDRLRPAAAR